MALRLEIIIGSTRPGRVGPTVAAWIAEVARETSGFEVELVDLAEVALPILDEPRHPSMRDYRHEHTKRWSEIVARGNAFVFVTPEYDYFPPAALVNAVQYLVHEWAKKPAGIVSYGGVSGGLRSTEALRQLLSAVGLVTLGRTVPVPFVANFVADGRLRPNDAMTQGAQGMVRDLAGWAEALKAMRG